MLEDCFFSHLEDCWRITKVRLVVLVEECCCMFRGPASSVCWLTHSATCACGNYSSFSVWGPLAKTTSTSKQNKFTCRSTNVFIEVIFSLQYHWYEPVQFLLSVYWTGKPVFSNGPQQQEWNQDALLKRLSSQDIGVFMCVLAFAFVVAWVAFASTPAFEFELALALAVVFCVWFCVCVILSVRICVFICVCVCAFASAQASICVCVCFQSAALAAPVLVLVPVSQFLLACFACACICVAFCDNLISACAYMGADVGICVCVCVHVCGAGVWVCINIVPCSHFIDHIHVRNAGLAIADRHKQVAISTTSCTFIRIWPNQMCDANPTAQDTSAHH